MAQVLEFRKRTKSQGRTTSNNKYPTVGDFEDEVKMDTSRLAIALSISNEEAIEVAAKFYRSYPMLIEAIRASVGGV